MTVKAYKLEWKPDEPATPALLEPMLDEMGLAEDGGREELEAREATKTFLSNLINDTPGEWEMGKLSTIADGFYAGYLAALKAPAVARQ